MILRSIQVEGWRCFASSACVGPFVDGLNIIHGPNGIGKSSLIMALARGLFDNHNVGGNDINSIRPWGRELAPKVTIEFEQNGDEFQLRKQFLDSPFAKLSKKENGQFVPIAESRAADERARVILSGEASSRGASDRRHWGLAQILWATQGGLKIGELASGTRATIQDALGAQFAGPGTEELEKRIADGYGQFFTSTGKLKSGASAPVLVNLQKQLANEKSTRAQIQQRLEEFDAASQRIEELRLQAQRARHSEQELNDQLKTARDRFQTYEKLQSQKKQHQLEVSAATESYQNLADRIESIHNSNQQRAEIKVRLMQLKVELPAQKNRVSRYLQQAQATDQTLKAMRGQRGEAATARQIAQLAERYDRNRQNCIGLVKLLGQIEETENEMNRLRQSRKQIVAPDKTTLKKITQIARLRDDARLQLDTALITVNMQLDVDTNIEVSSGESPGQRTIRKNDEHEIKGAPDIAFRIPGVGQFRVTGPTADFEKLHEQWKSAADRCDEMMDGFGCKDIVSLETLFAQADELEQAIAHLKVKLDTLLNGQSVELLRSNLKQANNALEQMQRDHADWKTAPPQPSVLAQHASEIEKKIGTKIENAELANDRAKEDHLSGSQELDRIQSEIKNLDSLAVALEERLKSIQSDGLGDRSRTNKLSKIALKRDVAQGKLNGVEEQIRELGEDTSKLVGTFEKQQQAFRAEADEAEKRLNIESGRLEQIVSEAPYSSLIETEEQIARIEEEITRQQLQIDAVRLLHETVLEQKQEVVHSLIDPIRSKANVILQRISGARFEDVQFDESLLPTGIAPRSHDDDVSLDQISGGEQEQVHFAVRMALADVAFPHDRQLVVLDDVFTYTDATRLARIASILEESAERFQIVLLTCHPERYRSLDAAQFFNLDNIAANYVH